MIGNGILADIVGYTIENGYNDINEYKRFSKKGWRHFIRCRNEEIANSEDRMEYICTKLKSLIKSVKIDNDVSLVCDYDAAVFPNVLIIRL